MTPEEFAQKMRELIVEIGDDPEVLHSEMDGLMCDLLRELGYGEGVDVFADTPKWYA